MEKKSQNLLQEMKLRNRKAKIMFQVLSIFFKPKVHLNNKTMNVCIYYLLLTIFFKVIN